MLTNKSAAAKGGGAVGPASPPPAQHQPTSSGAGALDAPLPGAFCMQRDQAARTALELPLAADAHLCPQLSACSPAPQLGSEGRHGRRHGTETLRLLPDLGRHRELPGARASIHIERALISAGGIPTADMPTAWGQPAAPVPSSLRPQPTARDTDTGLVACLGASRLLRSLVLLFSF